MVTRTACCVQVAALLLFSTSLHAADWPTFGHDPQRSGWAFEESTLAPDNVGQLELRWKTQVKNEPRSLTALTAPVVASGVTTPQGVKTVVYVAGSANNFFALDAKTGKLLWSRTFDSRSLPKDEGMWLCPNGINATPTIDRRTGTIYVIAVDGKLFGLDLGTGNVNFGPVQFVPPFSKSWSLNLVDHVLYTSISQGCGGAESGIYSVVITEPRHPVLRHLFISKGGGAGAGVWGRGGPVAGKNGRIYGFAGDGEFNPLTGEFGSTVVAASLGTMDLADYYTPTNWEEINKFDLDMGSGSPVWFAYKNYNLLAGGGKEGVVYLMDADSLGSKDHRTPLFVTPRLGNDERAFEGKGVWGALSAWRDREDQSWVYVQLWGPVSKGAPKFPVVNGATGHGSIMAFKVTTDSSAHKPLLEPAWVTGDFNLPEPPVIANGVVFTLSTGENAKQVQQGEVIQPNITLLTDVERGANTRNAVLYALDAKTGKVLFNSGNAFETWVHFSGLAVADGRVYAVDHDSRAYCFGLKRK